ncbi:MAG: ABC transporter ATP-binding protein [Chloroflexi bacterium]|nr:MAG: ABC transporter ATP-binding protein [Phototrophicales bacterium]RMF80281.1 MAG: ABC transporter ATP-binding protein [Chloroflexota bacterium]
MTLLQIHEVSKAFGGLQALNRVSLTVDEGEIVGLIGPNGSGKSTLFNVITGTIPATSGRIIFRDEDITGLQAHQIAQRGMGRTFQTVRPFMNLTTAQNVVAAILYCDTTIQSRHHAEKQAREILAYVGLLDEADSLASKLTIMQRKWLEVARALATNPKLLLLDEFMAGLNPTEIQLAVERVRKFRDEMDITIIIVEHIMKAITNCSDRIIVLNAGSKIAEGTPEAVVQDTHVIAAYLGGSHAKNR